MSFFADQLHLNPHPSSSNFSYVSVQVKEGLQLGIKLHEDSSSWDGR